MRSKPFRFTKNAAQANDSPRRPEWRRGAFHDAEPEPRFFRVAERFQKRMNESAPAAFMNNPGLVAGRGHEGAPPLLPTVLSFVESVQ